MRVVIWTLGLLVGGLIVVVAFTKACDLISAPSNFNVVAGLVIIAIIAGSALAAIFAALRGIASRMHPRVEVMPPSEAGDSPRRVEPD